MNSAMTRTQTRRPQQLIRLVMFSIAGYRLGLPLESILRVVNAPDELRSQTSEILQLLPLGEHTLIVLNLRSQLSMAQERPTSTQLQEEFLVVTKVGAELCAIRVDSPPDLIEIETTTIRQLPAPYRQGHPLSIASHVAVLPQGKATLAIFLLEMKRVLTLFGNSPQ